MTINIASIAQKAFTIAQTSFAAMGTLVTSTITGTTLSLQALRAGIKGTIVSLGLVGVAYLAVSTAVEALSAAWVCLETSRIVRSRRLPADEAQASLAGHQPKV